MNGFFKIHRKLFSKPIWRDSTIEQQVILLTLLGLANWQPSEYTFEGEVTQLKPGEFVASVEDIRLQIDKPEVTTKKIRLALDRFKNLEFLTVRRVSKKAISKSVFSIVNWQVYQIDDAEGKQKGKQKGRQESDQKGKQETSREACENAVSRLDEVEVGQRQTVGLGQREGQTKGQTSYYKRKDKEGYKNNIYITPRAHEQTKNKDQVNAKGKTADHHAGRVNRCMDYYQSAIHAFYSVTECDCVAALAAEFDEPAFMAAVDKAKKQGVNHASAWKYISAIFRTGGVKEFGKGSAVVQKKNDVVSVAAAAAKLLESGGVLDL